MHIHRSTRVDFRTYVSYVLTRIHFAYVRVDQSKRFVYTLDRIKYTKVGVIFGYGCQEYRYKQPICY